MGRRKLTAEQIEIRKAEKLARQKAYALKNKEDIAERRRAWYQANKERISAKQKAYYQENLEAVRARQKARLVFNGKNITEEEKIYQKAYQKLHREKNRKEFRDYQRLRNSGFNESLFTLCKQMQGNKCPICLTSFEELKSSRVHADHCHKDEKPRGVLCGRCNSALGMLKDSRENLLRAIEYLDNPPLGIL